MFQIYEDTVLVLCLLQIKFLRRFLQLNVVYRDSVGSVPVPAQKKAGWIQIRKNTGSGVRPTFFKMKTIPVRKAQIRLRNL